MADGFKKTVKMACFKEGGSIQRQVKDFTKRDRKDVSAEAPAKKVVKKAFGMHDSQLHDDEKTDLTGLKKGGRAKKATGTVKKYKAGGSVENVYGAKKKSGDLDRIQKTKDIKPGKAKAPNAATKHPAMKGSDVAKEKSKPAGDAVKVIKSKQSGKAAEAKSGAKGGPNKYKTGGKVKKFDVGGLTGAAPMSPVCATTMPAETSGAPTIATDPVLCGQIPVDPTSYTMGPTSAGSETLSPGMIATDRGGPTVPQIGAKPQQAPFTKFLQQAQTARPGMNIPKPMALPQVQRPGMNASQMALLGAKKFNAN